MPAATVPKTPLAVGAGYLYYGAIGTSLPANTVVGSVFTDAWPGGWNLLGVTSDGSEFDYTVSTDTIDAAEYLDPLVIVTTGRAAAWKMSLQLITATNWKRALNGGSLIPSGSGTTLLSTYTPPVPGTEVRSMIGWEATDNTERLIMEQAFQSGSLSVMRKKGKDNAELPLEWHAEIATSGNPFIYYTAGVARG
jgi:hypothetical protein